MSTIEERVIARINKQIGSSFDNLHQSRQLVSEYESKFKEITSKLSLDKSLDDDAPQSHFQSTVRSIEITHEAIDVQIAKIEQYQSKIEHCLEIYDGHLEAVSEPQRKIDKLERLAEYLRVVQDITDISEALKANLDHDSKVVSLYLSLCGEVNSTNSVIGRLEYVEARHLKAFAEKTAVYWYNFLVEKFSKEFESCLKSIKWPNMGNANEVFAPSKPISHKLAMLAEFLFLIKHPKHDHYQYTVITPSVLCPPISLPTQLLLKPFRQRFLYHFSGAKQTNRLDKPEWFYTQILSWAKDNHAFVGSTFQIAANHSGNKDVNVRLEFIRGLVQLVVEKLCHDIEEIATDDHLFAHLLDESLSFEQELRETFRYPITFPSALTVLTQAQYLMKWLLAEENFSTSQMDAMMTRGTPWVFIDPINLEELKIPKCADQFVRLLDAIKERYCVLPQPGHQMQFLNLQIELIDSFRRRLVQLHNSSEDNVSSTKVLNAIHYLVSVLREWGESVHYLHLNVAHIGHIISGGGGDSDADEVPSVFEKPIGEFEHWDRQIVADLAAKVVDDIKAKSMPYRHDHWVTMPALGSAETFALSASAGEMFQVMVSDLHDLETELSVSILNNVLRMVAARLDVFIIDGMIMNTRFSVGGAAQLNYDMTRNLFPLFGQYLARPHLLFKRIHDACILLTLPAGSALLLHETLKEQRNADDARTVLSEIGVVSLTGRLARDILGRRTDITI